MTGLFRIEPFLELLRLLIMDDHDDVLIMFSHITTDEKTTLSRIFYYYFNTISIAVEVAYTTLVNVNAVAKARTYRLRQFQRNG